MPRGSSKKDALPAAPGDLEAREEESSAAAAAEAEVEEVEVVEVEDDEEGEGGAEEEEEEEEDREEEETEGEEDDDEDWDEGEEGDEGEDEESEQAGAGAAAEEAAAAAPAAAEGEEAEAEAEAAEGSPPKLAEGYYEIETIRRRRLRKGELQYLVKWRGWPESANTWEPFENLKACIDFVDAFEKRSNTPKLCRKRKRKTTTTPVTGPSTSHGKRGRPPRSGARSVPRPPAPEPNKLPSWTRSRRTSNNSKASVGEPEASTVVVGEQMLGQNVVHDGNSGGVSAVPQHEAPLSVSLTEQQDGHHLVNGFSKPESLMQTPPMQGGQVTGAKKRKCGSVKRFKNDLVPQQQVETPKDISVTRTEGVGSTEGETSDKNRREGCAKQIHITKILRPVRYLATINDDVQQVSITFKALRSDGQEVLVDDKELKANNPLVLINYYEQHLRYNPTL